MLLALPRVLLAVLRVYESRIAAVRLHVVNQKQPRLGAGLAQQVLQGVISIQEAWVHHP